MPSVLPPSLVLVSGASGFSACWVVKRLLEDGYRVHGTVRSEPKGVYLRNLFKQYGDKFATVIVPDISQRGAFDDVLKGIHAVIHIAAAVSVDGIKTSMLSPNTEGVGYLLESIKDHGNCVKRFVYMSSAKALTGKPLGHIYNEDDWNDKAVLAMRELGDGVDGESAYAACKVLAERAVVNFTERNDLPWDVTRIVPVWIYGPIIHDCKSFDDLNLSTKVMYQYLTSAPDGSKLNDHCTDYIDVRDVAATFIASLKVEAAGGKRFLLDAGSKTYQNLYDAIHAISPDMPSVPYGDTKAKKFTFKNTFVDSSAAKEVLQLDEFIDIGRCARDTLISLNERNLVAMKAHM